MTGEPAVGPEASVQRPVAAPAGALWSLVTDITLPARFSSELQGAEWCTDPPRAVGSVFRGHNRNDFMGAWTTTCTVIAYDEPRAFGWAVGSGPAATWWFEIEPDERGCVLRLRARLGPGPSGLTAAIAQNPDAEPEIVAWRLADLGASMQATVDGIASLAEGGSPQGQG